MEWLEVWEGWMAGALVLLVLELLLPGFYLLWFGLAGMLVALIAAIFGGLSWQLALVLFALFSMASIFLGDRFLRKRLDAPSGVLNHRQLGLVGQVVVVEGDIIAGQGRVKVGDSSWMARLENGGDLPAGERVTVLRSEGTILVVQRLS